MKFFNKKRYEMLNGKRLSKYLVYASGEIILVVIGILIALWINNWNKEQQIANTNTQLQQKVLMQLEKDITNIANFRKELDTLDNVYLSYLKRDYDEAKASGKNVFSLVLFEVAELGLDKNNQSLIGNAQLDNSEASQQLTDLNAIYKLYFKNIDDIEQVIYKKLSDNLEFLEQTQPWYTELITDFNCKTDCVIFLSSDENFKAKIASLRLLYIKAYGDLVRGFFNELTSAKDDLKVSMKTTT